jgi:regulator of cell morphogenesis and NO signaling
MSIAPAPEVDLDATIDRVLAEHVALRRDLGEALKLAEGPLLDAIAELAAELEEHMLKEERVLLPWIRAGRGSTARAPIRAMLIEHESTLAGVARIRDLTGGYDPPNDGLAPLYRRLGVLDRFLHAHISLENDVLFPRALRG